MVERGLMGRKQFLPASHSLPPTQLSTLPTLDLLHIKETSLQKPSHMHREMQGGRTREPGGRKEEGVGRWRGLGGEQPHSHGMQRCHSNPINFSSYVPHLARPWTRPGRYTRKGRTAWIGMLTLLSYSSCFTISKKDTNESSLFPARPPRRDACACGRNIVSPRLALEVRRRFIFLVRPLSKNILCNVLSVRQVPTRQSPLTVRGELLRDWLLLSFG